MCGSLPDTFSKFHRRGDETKPVPSHSGQTIVLLPDVSMLRDRESKLHYLELHRGDSIDLAAAVTEAALDPHFCCRIAPHRNDTYSVTQGARDDLVHFRRAGQRAGSLRSTYTAPLQRASLILTRYTDRIVLVCRRRSAYRNKSHQGNNYRSNPSPASRMRRFLRSAGTCIAGRHQSRNHRVALQAYTLGRPVRVIVAPAGRFASGAVFRFRFLGRYRRHH